LSSNSYLFKRSPVWRHNIQAPRPELGPSSELSSWLNETGSLTKRLRSHFGERLKVNILFHYWKPAFVDESRILQVPDRRYQLIREVVLQVDQRPLVLARTVLPEATIRIAHRNLSHLGTRPLGEVIFSYPDLERRLRQFSLVQQPDWSDAAVSAFGIVAPLWGRRTIYAIHRQPLLVSEFFFSGWIKGNLADLGLVQ
jgi:chorismate--pyruvate lyase